MLDVLNRFWIGMPLLYSLTVTGLFAGFRRGRMPIEQRWRRALLSGVPVLLGALIAWNIIANLVEPPGTVRQFESLRMVLGIIFVACSSALIGSLIARLSSKRALERGTVLLDEEAQGSRATQPGELTLAGCPFSLSDETKHFKMIGTTGTGKSTAITELLTQALGRGDRAVIADPDGGYLDQFYDPARGDKVLNPLDSRAVRWDLFAEIVKLHDADQLARSMIPDHEGQDRHWRNYARTFMSSVFRQLHRTNEPSLAVLYTTLVTALPADLRDMLQGTPAATFLAKDNGKFFDSIRSIAVDHLAAAIEHLARQTHDEAISVRKWIR